MRKLIPFFILLVSLSVPAVAIAAAAAPDDDALGSLVRAMAQAILDGHYLVASAVILSIVTTLARLSWKLTGLGSSLLLGAHAFTASLAASLIAGVSPSWSLLGTALRLGVLAAGGYSLLQPLARWLRPMIERSIPQPLRSLLLALLRLVDASPPASSATPPASPASPLAAALVLGMLLTSCAATRGPLAAGATAGLDCAGPEISATVSEAGEMARSYVITMINGSGVVDSGRLRAAARELKATALRCALVAAVAAISDASRTPQGIMSAAEPKPNLRDAMREIAASEWQITGPIIVGGDAL